MGLSSKSSDAGKGAPSALAPEAFEQLLSAEEIDQAFAAVELGTWTPPSAEASVAATDLTEVRALFGQLAASHVRQVRDFVIDLRLSDAPAHWIGVCEPAVRSLRRAADKLELADLCAALDGFADALAAATSPGAGSIDGEWRATLLTRYDELAARMPQAFALDLDRSQRESVILQSLLLQVPGVRKVTIDKLYGAGLTTLEAMLLATPGDMAATTGIPEELAARIVERFRAYREHVRSTVPDATRAQERERITELTARLRREHYDHELASQGWSRDAEAKKRQLRKARVQTLLDIQVVLARLGEFERLKELERAPFEKKLALLEAFLEEAHEKYAAQA
jgi:hypothetical protein